MDNNILIPGVYLTPLRQIYVSEGDVFHAIKKSSEHFMGFGEAYFSLIHQNSIKGWKKHNQVTLNIVVPVGSIRFVIFDDRRESPANGTFWEVTIGEHNYCRLTVCPGLWVAFQGVSDKSNLLLNLIDEEHDPDEATNVSLSKYPYF